MVVVVCSHEWNTQKKITLKSSKEPRRGSRVSSFSFQDHNKLWIWIIDFLSLLISAKITRRRNKVNVAYVLLRETFLCCLQRANDDTAK